MKRCFGTVVAVLSVVLLWFMLGCGDDDSTSSQLEVGDLNDPEFLAAVGAMDMTNVDDPAKQAYYDVGDFVSQIMSPLKVGADRDTPAGMAQQGWQIVYDEDSKYWYRTLQVTQDPWLDHIDSLQFVHIDGPAQWPVTDSLIEFRMGTAQYVGQAADTILDGHRICSVGADYDGGVPFITINLTQTLKHHGLPVSMRLKQAVVTDLDLVASTTVTGAVINPDTDLDCPESGQAKSSVNLYVQYFTGDTTLTFSGNWRIDATYDGDSTIVTMNNGKTRWTFNEYCITVKDGGSQYLSELLRRRE